MTDREWSEVMMVWAWVLLALALLLAGADALEGVGGPRSASALVKLFLAIVLFR